MYVYNYTSYYNNIMQIIVTWTKMVTISALAPVNSVRSSYTTLPKVIDLFEVLDAKHGLIDIDDI